MNGTPTNLLKLAVLVQLHGYSDEVDSLAFLGELQHRLVDVAVRFTIEIFRLQNSLHFNNYLFIT